MYFFCPLVLQGHHRATQYARHVTRKVYSAPEESPLFELVLVLRWNCGVSGSVTQKLMAPDGTVRQKDRASRTLDSNKPQRETWGGFLDSSSLFFGTKRKTHTLHAVPNKLENVADRLPLPRGHWDVLDHV